MGDNNTSFEESSTPYLVSVVIPAFRRMASLETCLESVSQSDYAHVETIVVDDSPDGKIGSMVKRRFPLIKVVRTRATNLFPSLGTSAHQPPLANTFCF